MTGPAGIGKTTTVRLIAKQLGIELAEWTEGVDDRSLGEGSGRSYAGHGLTSRCRVSGLQTDSILSAQRLSNIEHVWELLTLSASCASSDLSTQYHPPENTRAISQRSAGLLQVVQPGELPTGDCAL